MYVCICNNVTQSDIDDAVRDGARTLDCLTERLGVASCCGQCEDVAADHLDASLQDLVPVAPLPLRPLVSEPPALQLRLVG